MPTENQPTLPEITSFVIRFISSESSEHSSGDDNFAGSTPAYRGVIRHIQTNRELAFTHWKEAEAFIGQFVNLEPDSATLSSTQEISGNEPQK